MCHVRVYAFVRCACHPWKTLITSWNPRDAKSSLRTSPQSPYITLGTGSTTHGESNHLRAWHTSIDMRALSAVDIYEAM